MLGKEGEREAHQLPRNLLQRKKKGILKKAERKRRRIKKKAGRIGRKEVRLQHQMALRMQLPASLLWMVGTQKMLWYLLLLKRLQGERNPCQLTLFLMLLLQRRVDSIPLLPCPLLKDGHIRKADRQRKRMGKKRERNKVPPASKQQAFQGSQADNSFLPLLWDPCWHMQRNSL